MTKVNPTMLLHVGFFPVIIVTVDTAYDFHRTLF
jgi:hypothetical protein